MNIAIVGCGHIAAIHASSLRGLGQRMTVCVDSNLKNAQTFAQNWGFARHSASLADALVPDVDCVHLCTPPTLHYEMAKTVLAAGKHLVCEKPLCFSPAEAKELYELALEKQVLAAVNFNVRFNEACRAAKEQIAQPGFGPLQLVSGSYKQEFHTLPTAFGWRYLPELSGKMRAVTEIGSHWVDLARYWTGREVEAVSANFGCFIPQRVVKDGLMYPADEAEGEALEIATEDAAVVTLRFTGGVLGSLLLNEAAHGRRNELALEVNGRHASVWWNSEDPYRLHQSGGGDVCTSVNAFAGGFPDSFAALFAAVYGALEAGDFQSTAFPGFYDGWKNAAVCEAIWQSAQNGGAWTAAE